MTRISPELLAKLIEIESGGNPRAVSPVGAQGVMQIMPDTARDPGYGVRPIADPFDPRQAVPFGRDYLGAMLAETGDMREALAAYNAGLGNTRAGMGYADKVLSARPSRRSIEMVQMYGGDGGEEIVTGGSGKDLLGDPAELAKQVFAPVAPPEPASDGAPPAADQPSAAPAKDKKSAIEALGDPAELAKQVFASAPAGESIPQAPAPVEPPSEVESLGMGMADPVHALNQKVYNAAYAPARAVGLDIPEWMPGAKYDTKLKAREDQYQKRRGPDAGFDWWRTGGSVATTAPLAFIPGANTIAGSAAIGGLSGMLEPQTGGEYSGREDLARFGIGGVAGGATAGTLKGIGHGLQSIRPAPRNVTMFTGPQSKHNAQAALLRDAGIHPTPGQALGGSWKATEDKMTSLPLAGSDIVKGRRRTFHEFNTAIYRNALEPLGISLPNKAKAGRETVKWIHDTISDVYDDVLNRASFIPDQQYAADIGNIQQMVSALPDGAQTRFNEEFKTAVLDKLSPAGRTTGQSFKEIESELGQLYRAYSNPTQQPNLSIGDQRRIGNAFREVQRIFRDTLSRQNPDIADELAAANAAYSRVKIMEDAAARAGSENGVITPTAYNQAVKAADFSKNKGRYARGDANMQELSDAARAVLPQKYPDSGTAGREGLFNPLAWGQGLAAKAITRPVYGWGTGHKALSDALMSRSTPFALNEAGRQIERSSPLAALLSGSTAPGLVP